MHDVIVLHMAALAEAGAHGLRQHHVNVVCQALSRVEAALASEPMDQDGYSRRVWAALSSWGRILVNQEDWKHRDGGTSTGRQTVGSWEEASSASRVCLRVAVRLAVSLHHNGLLHDSEVKAGLNVAGMHRSGLIRSIYGPKGPISCQE